VLLKLPRGSVPVPLVMALAVGLLVHFLPAEPLTGSQVTRHVLCLNQHQHQEGEEEEKAKDADEDGGDQHRLKAEVLEDFQPGAVSINGLVLHSHVAHNGGADRLMDHMIN